MRLDIRATVVQLVHHQDTTIGRDIVYDKAEKQRNLRLIQKMAIKGVFIIGQLLPTKTLYILRYIEGRIMIAGRDSRPVRGGWLVDNDQMIIITRPISPQDMLLQ